MARHHVAACCLLLGLAGCSHTTATPAPSSSAPTAAQTATPTPAPASSASVQPSPAAPTTRVATPAPSTAGDLDASVFQPTVGRWRAVPGSGDEGTYEPNGTWVHAVPPDQAVSSLSMQACTTPPALPRPVAVLASDYQDAGGRRAVGQALRMRSAAEATAFVEAYRRLVAACQGRSSPMAVSSLSATGPVVDRRTMQADHTRWLEVVRAEGSMARMFVANEQDQPLTPAEVAAVTARA